MNNDSKVKFSLNIYKCDNCSSTNSRLLYNFKEEIDSFYDKKKRLIYVFKCSDCKLIYAKVFQSSQDKQRVDEIFFDETYLHQESESCTISDFNGVLNKIKKYRGYGRLLDIGCGQGYFLKFAQDKGWNVEGIETAKNAVRHALKLRLKVKNKSLEDSSYPDSYFSTITQLGLIEHVESPRKLLQESNRILKKKGVIVIFTPNAGSLFHFMADIFYKLTGSYFAIKKIYYSRHLFYFTKKTLTAMLKKEGFEIREIQLVSLDMNKQFFTLFRKQKWARNPLIKIIAYFILALSKLLRMETHMIIYAVKS